MSNRLMFLSDGEMMVYDGGKAIRLHSERKALYIRTAHSLEERNAWKYEGAGANFQQQVNPYTHRSRTAETACQIRAAAPWKDQLLYALTTPEIGGLFLQDMNDDDAPEGNWLSDREFRPVDLHARGDQVVLALDSVLGERHIALMQGETPRYEIITQGDTQDSAPFLCADGRTMYYVSSGWARDEEGHPIAKGPSALLRLDLRSGDLDEVAAEDGFDYLRPKEGPDGVLYVIRRPYKSDAPKRIGFVQRVKNIGAAFKGLGKILQAIGDPEGTAKRTPRVAGQSVEAAQKRMLEGIMLDITRGGENGSEDEGCIPADWVLLRQTADGHFEEVQKGVADYDFDGDALVYSDGRRIIRVEDGKKTVLYKAVFIPRIVVCG